MGNVDLGGKPTKTDEPKKVKVIYLSIPTSLAFIHDCWEYPKAKRFALVMVESIISSMTRKEIRKEVLGLFKMKTVQKLKKYNKPAYDIFTEAFGAVIWGK